MTGWAFLLASALLFALLLRAAVRYDDRQVALARAMRRIDDALLQARLTLAYPALMAAAVRAMDDWARGMQQINDTIARSDEAVRAFRLAYLTELRMTLTPTQQSIMDGLGS